MGKSERCGSITGHFFSVATGRQVFGLQHTGGSTNASAKGADWDLFGTFQGWTYTIVFFFGGGSRDSRLDPKGEISINLRIFKDPWDEIRSIFFKSHGDRESSRSFMTT